jgi:hypothetical protein
MVKTAWRLTSTAPVRLHGTGATLSLPLRCCSDGIAQNSYGIVIVQAGEFNIKEISYANVTWAGVAEADRSSLMPKGRVVCELILRPTLLKAFVYLGILNQEK